jgi:hypothetical protein
MATSFQVSPDLLPPTGHKPAFSSVGVGGILERSISAGLFSDKLAFPFLARGRTLLIVADFGGHHQKQHFDTYTFLIMDFARNREWLVRQHKFRKATLPNRRRMSFKALNDNMRRRALVPFMRAAAGIEGCLVQFAISKAGGSLFTRASEDERGTELLNRWKPNVQERLLRVLHLSAFLLSGLSAPGQDVPWIVDEDDIAANVPMLTDLTELYARLLSSCCSSNTATTWPLTVHWPRGWKVEWELVRRAPTCMNFSKNLSERPKVGNTWSTPTFRHSRKKSRTNFDLYYRHLNPCLMDDRHLPRTRYRRVSAVSCSA